ncbi:MAG: hypothetical protein D6814_06120 [Calditrichaeota bacterium]|nr:MAG: hypothetical protein D6814_06120 [Calditrichota bacterium]
MKLIRCSFLLLLALILVFGQSPTRAQEKPLFTFLHLSDMQFGSFGEYEKGMAYFVQQIKNNAYFPAPDFILVTGDIADHGKPEEYQFYKKMMDQIGLPYYTIPGNHYDGDFHGIHQAYLDIIGRDKMNYYFQYKGFRFIMLARYNSLVDFNWVEDLVASSPGPVFICDHYPLYPPRTAGKAQSYYMPSPEIEAMFKKYPGKIIAFLSGHSHINSLLIKDGVYQINTQALAVRPDGFRLFRVFKDRIEVRTYFLQETPGTFFWWGGYQWNDTDAEHPTVDSYNFGNEAERNFTIPLSSELKTDTEAPSPPKNVKVVEQ